MSGYVTPSPFRVKSETINKTGMTYESRTVPDNLPDVVYKLIEPYLRTRGSSAQIAL